jgi:hypothetical protein
LRLCDCQCCPGVNFLVLAKGDICDAVDLQLEHIDTREHELNRILVIEGRTPSHCYYCPGYDHPMTDAEWDQHCDTKTHKIICNRALNCVLMCDLCNYELADEEHRKEHNETSRHQAKVRAAYHCKSCNYTTTNPTHWDRHRQSNKCPLPTPTYIKPPRKKTNFYCKLCDFYAPNNCKLSRHFGTNSHKIRKLESAEKKGIYPYYLEPKKWFQMFFHTFIFWKVS